MAILRNPVTGRRFNTTTPSGRRTYQRLLTAGRISPAHIPARRIFNPFVGANGRYQTRRVYERWRRQNRPFRRWANMTRSRMRTQVAIVNRVVRRLTPNVIPQPPLTLRDLVWDWRNQGGAMTTNVRWRWLARLFFSDRMPPMNDFNVYVEQWRPTIGGQEEIFPNWITDAQIRIILRNKVIRQRQELIRDSPIDAVANRCDRLGNPAYDPNADVPVAQYRYRYVGNGIRRREITSLVRNNVPAFPANQVRLFGIFDGLKEPTDGWNWQDWKWETKFYKNQKLVGTKTTNCVPTENYVIPECFKAPRLPTEYVNQVPQGEGKFAGKVGYFVKDKKGNVSKTKVSQLILHEKYPHKWGDIDPLCYGHEGDDFKMCLTHTKSYMHQVIHWNTGCCVPLLIYQKYHSIDGYRKLPFKWFMEQLGMLNVREGCPLIRLPKLFEELKQHYYCLNVCNQLIEHFKPKEKHRRSHPFFFVIANTHMYPIEDKTLRKKVTERAKAKVFIPDVQKGKYVSKYPIYEKKDVVIFDSEINKGEGSLMSVLQQYKNKCLAFTNANIEDLFIQLIKESGVVCDKWLNWKVNLRSFYFPLWHIMFVSSEHIRQELEACEKLKVEWKQQSISSIIGKHFSEKFPKHRKSRFNKRVKDQLCELPQRWLEVFGGVKFSDFEITPDLYKQTFSFDFNKFYTYCASSGNEWAIPQYTIFDTDEPYDGGDIKCGEYYIETTNVWLRWSGWKPWQLVKYGLEQKYITKEDIKRQINASYLMPNNYLTSWMEGLYKKLTTKCAKKCVNYWIGSQGKKSVVAVKGQVIGNNLQELSRYYFGNERAITTQIDDNLYKVSWDTEHKYHEFNINISRHIYANQFIHLDKLRRCLGGRLLLIKTDCIVVQCPNLIKLAEDYRMANKIGDLRETEIPDFDRYYYDDAKIRRHIQPYQPTEEGWSSQIILPNKFNEEITKKIYDWMRKGGFLEGDAGTGKSYAIEAFIKKMTEEAGEKPFREGHEYFKVAPTNSAANRISGKTFHKAFKMDRQLKIAKVTAKNISNTQYIFVDELSMCGFGILNMLIQIHILNPKVIFIMSGDYKQHEPVEPHLKLNIDYRNSRPVQELCGHRCLRLTYNHRFKQDPVLGEIMGHYDNGFKELDLTQFGTKKCRLNITYTNLKKNFVNIAWMDKEKVADSPTLKDTYLKKRKVNWFFGGFGVVYDECAIYTDDNKKHKQLKMTICPNMPIIGTKPNNDYGINIFRNGFYIVIGWNDNDILVKDEEGKEAQIPRDKFPRHFQAGYAITSHVAQGLTFDMEYSIWDWNHFYFKVNARYVALSRATNHKNINIIL